MVKIVFLLAQIMFSSDAENVEIHKHGSEIQINIDGQEYRMIQSMIGEAISTEQ